MKRILYIFTLLCFINVITAKADSRPISTDSFTEIMEDSARLVQLDYFWNQLALTVKEGNYEDYGALYHPDAVVVFATGENRSSVPLADAMKSWKAGFDNTKSGKQHDSVEFRFSQRIGNETTAHETGIFVFTSRDADGTLKGEYRIHFEMLLVKKDNQWLALMEHQKSVATEDEWDTLKK